MRAYKQLFFDNKKTDFQQYGISGKKIIEEGTPRLLHDLLLLNYIIEEIRLQAYQVVFLLVRGDYTIEIKYGGRVESITRFMQLSTEANNPDWKNIENLVKRIFSEKKEE